MKKITPIIVGVLAFVLLFTGVILSACEKSTRLRTATISEITAAGSENYGVRISFQEDSRIQDKYISIQVKASKPGMLTMWEEGDDKFDITFTEFDEWYSVESLIAAGKGSPNSEKFEKYKGAPARTYLFNYDGKIELTFRVVVGQIEDNSSGIGEILVGSEVVSKQFTLKIK